MDQKLISRKNKLPDRNVLKLEMIPVTGLIDIREVPTPCFMLLLEMLDASECCLPIPHKTIPFAPWEQFKYFRTGILYFIIYRGEVTIAKTRLMDHLPSNYTSKRSHTQAKS